jgi:hypothetical protein
MDDRDDKAIYDDGIDIDTIREHHVDEVEVRSEHDAVVVDIHGETCVTKKYAQQQGIVLRFSS